MEPLKEGEKYLTIQLLGKDGLKAVAFANKKKLKETDPDFRGDGIAVWINAKKANPSAQSVL